MRIIDLVIFTTRRNSKEESLERDGSLKPPGKYEGFYIFNWFGDLGLEFTLFCAGKWFIEVISKNFFISFHFLYLPSFITSMLEKNRYKLKKDRGDQSVFNFYKPKSRREEEESLGHSNHHYQSIANPH